MVNITSAETLLGNTSAQQPRSLLVFGFIPLPQKYEDEKDVAMGLVALMSIISIIANGILLLVIVNDPFKQLRTITAILLAFNSAANLISSFVLFLDSLFYWSGGTLSPELIVYFCSFTSYLYVIGNLLHTLNTYGAIVVPVRYAILVPKIRRLLVQCLVLIWVVILLLVVIPPYALPKDKVPTYIQGLLTLICVLLVLLAIIFAYLYTKIFRSFYARKQRFSLSYHLKRSTVQGRTMNKKNSKIVKTLFAQVLFFMITTVPGSVICLVFLHCTRCDPLKIQLAALFAIPIAFSSMVFLPLFWLFRLNNYRHAMIKTLSCCQISRNIQGSTGSLEKESKWRSRDTPKGLSVK